MHEFNWGFDLTVIGLILDMQDKRKPAKKVDVLNRAAYLGMDRERTEQAINELLQMGQIILIKGGDADWDRLKVVDEKRIHRHRRSEIADNLTDSED